jgi:Lipocalin-like domain
MKKIILSVFVLSTVLVSCKKDDKNCDLNAGNFVGSYKVSAISYKANTATPVVDEYATLPACQKDDVITFNANNTSNYTDAGTVCTPNGSDVGVWTLSGGSVTLDGDVYAVASFSCSGMTISQAGPAAGELYTVTLVKQ